jgi:hypothetical protein
VVRGYGGEGVMKLRVWWKPQIPCESFYTDVDTVEEGAKLLDTLAKYDAFQYENRIKPDYCNIGGLEMLEDGEWCDWYDENGNDLDEYMEIQEQEAD